MGNRYKDAAVAAGFEMTSEQLGVAGWEFQAVSTMTDERGNPLYYGAVCHNVDEAWKRVCIDHNIYVSE